VRECENLTAFMCRMSWKSGSLNLLEPSGPHRACYGIPLLYIYQQMQMYIQGDRRESDGLKKKKYSVVFQLEMGLFLQN